MKTLVILIITISVTLTSFTLNGQTSDQLPKEWHLKISSPITYQVITTHYNYSMMGPFLNKTQVSGLFTRKSPEGMVQWNHVKIATANQLEEQFPAGIEQASMENFSYIPSEKMLEPGAFKSFPQDESSHLFRNLVWDMMGFEFFAWAHSGSLKLNQEFKATDANFVVDLAGQGTFENKDIRLTWIGNTTKNQEKCAIIKFSVMNNPLKMDSDNLKLTGRSHYWGNIYVSISTKQIEYAELYEDVIMELNFSHQPDPQMMNTIRTITVEKVSSEVATLEGK